VTDDAYAASGAYAFVSFAPADHDLHERLLDDSRPTRLSLVAVACAAEDL
jgi:hypothetical protein